MVNTAYNGYGDELTKEYWVLGLYKYEINDLIVRFDCNLYNK
jgi:hypothetical protein